MSLENDFLPVAIGGSANVESQAAYAADPLLTNGNQPGTAVSAFNNKALRQGTFVVSQFCQWIANKLNANVLDDGVPANLLAQIYAAEAPNSSMATENLTFVASVSGGNLTVTLQTLLGVAPSATDVVYIGFRGATAGNGNYTVVPVTSSLSVTLNSGSSVGMLAGIQSTLYLIAINNGGTVALGLINETLIDEGSLHNVTTEGGGAATSQGTIYSASSYSSVPTRIIGRIIVTESVPGTWTTAPSECSVPPFIEGGVTYGSQTMEYSRAKNQTVIIQATNLNSGTTSAAGVNANAPGGLTRMLGLSSSWSSSGAYVNGDSILEAAHNWRVICLNGGSFNVYCGDSTSASLGFAVSATTGLCQIGATGQTPIHILNTATTTSANAGSHGAVPAQVAGYVEINVNGTNVKIPYFAV